MVMIIHVDMDAFYASVEARERPELAGRPIIVGGTPAQRGVVAAANYVARRHGIHSAMPSAVALRRCPEAVLLPVRMDLYAQVSAAIHDIFARYTPEIEPLSLDEAFLDVTRSKRLFGPAESIARRIKEEIRAELRLVASVGVAPNKFLAKLASDLDKPDGFRVVPAATVQEFLDPLPVTRLWGVGEVAAATCARLRVRTIGELRRLPLSTLLAHFGRQGQHLWELAHGIDERPVVADREAKSMSRETTFATDIRDAQALRACLRELTAHVAWRLRRQQLAARTVQIKVRFADFRTITRAQTLAEPSATTQTLWRTAAALLETHLLADGGQRQRGVRLLGMGASGLSAPSPVQAVLFAPAPSRQALIDGVADDLNARFGPAALRRGLAPKTSQ